VEFAEAVRLLLAGSERHRFLQGQAGAEGKTRGALIRRDERTGENYLRLPMPHPELLQQALQSLSGLVQQLASRGA
jgi:hypothetical protein